MRTWSERVGKAEAMRLTAWFLVGRIVLAAWGDGRGVDVLPRGQTLIVVPCATPERRATGRLRARVLLRMDTDGRARLGA